MLLEIKKGVCGDFPKGLINTMQYWLMKSEPSAFSIEDLKKAPKQSSSWDGVRKYQARNFMRDEMKVGDQIFFYHSNTKTPAIVAICKVASDPYPDPTQFNPKSKYYDPQSDRVKPRWILVDVAFVKDFGPITLEQIKANPKLKNMKLVQKGSILSVQPVSQEEWDTITQG